MTSCYRNMTPFACFVVVGLFMFLCQIKKSRCVGTLDNRNNAIYQRMTYVWLMWNVCFSHRQTNVYENKRNAELQRTDHGTYNVILQLFETLKSREVTYINIFISEINRYISFENWKFEINLYKNVLHVVLYKEKIEMPIKSVKMQIFSLMSQGSL